MPMVVVRGPSTGARMIRAALISINMPTASSRERIRAIMTLGLLDRNRKNAAIFCGICIKVIHQLRIEALAIIRKTMPVILAVRISISTISLKLMAR